MNNLDDFFLLMNTILAIFQELLVLLERYFPEVAFVMLVGVVLLFGYVVLKLSEAKK